MQLSISNPKAQQDAIDLLLRGGLQMIRLVIRVKAGCEVDDRMFHLR